MTGSDDLSDLSQQQMSTLIHVERLLMAPCCFTQTVDVHMSDIAQTMRQEVASMVRQGQRDSDIFEHYKAIYGEQILAVPDGRLGTTAFAIPVTVSTLAAGTLALALYRFHRRKAALMRDASIDPASGRMDQIPVPDEAKALLMRIRAATDL